MTDEEREENHSYQLGYALSAIERFVAIQDELLDRPDMVLTPEWAQAYASLRKLAGFRVGPDMHDRPK